MKITTRKIQAGWYGVSVDGKEIGTVNNFKGFWTAKLQTRDENRRVISEGFVSCAENTRKGAIERIVEAYQK